MYGLKRINLIFRFYLILHCLQSYSLRRRENWECRRLQQICILSSGPHRQENHTTKMCKYKICFYFVLPDEGGGGDQP